MLYCQVQSSSLSVISLCFEQLFHDEDRLWDTLYGARGAKDTATNDVVTLILDLHPELIEVVTGDRHNTVLHIFGFRTRGQLFSEELMLKCWQMNPGAVHKVNRKHDTPFHVALRSDNQFAVELVQWKLPLDEVVSAYVRCKKECPRLIFDHLGGCLLQALNKDVVRVIYDYALDDPTADETTRRTNKNKRKRDNDDDHIDGQDNDLVGDCDDDDDDDEHSGGSEEGITNEEDSDY